MAPKQTAETFRLGATPLELGWRLPESLCHG